MLLIVTELEYKIKLLLLHYIICNTIAIKNSLRSVSQKFNTKWINCTYYITSKNNLYFICSLNITENEML